MDEKSIMNFIHGHSGISVYIWGAGALGTEVYDALTADGVSVRGFIDNYIAHAAREDLKNIAVLRPNDIPADSFVVIAARASAFAIMLELMELGFGRDQYTVWQSEGCSAPAMEGNDRLLLEDVFQNEVCHSLPCNVLTLETSDRCNLLCAMCGYQKRCLYLGLHKEKEPKFDCTPILPVLNTVKTLVLNIAGEPLLHGAIWDVLDLLKNSNYGNLKSIQFHTNGQLLDQNDNIPKLAELPVPLTISFSTDAAGEETYRKIRGADFKHLLGNIQQMIKAFEQAGRRDDNMQINATLMRENVEQFPRFIQMARELGIRSVITRPISYRYDVDFTFAKSNRNGFDFDYDQQALQYYPQLTKRILAEARETAEKNNMILYIDGAFESSVYSDMEDLPYPITTDEFWRMIGDRKKQEAGKIASNISYLAGDRIPMKRRCYRPWTDVSIQKDGGVCMCLWLAGKLIGNINDAPFDEVWNSKEARRIRREMIEGFLPDVCEKALCKYRQEAVMAYMSEKKTDAIPSHGKSC